MSERSLPALLSALVLTACVAETAPSQGACAADAVAIEVAVSADGMTPTNLQACRGQTVELVVRSEVDGVFHVHGYDDQVGAVTIEDGVDTRLEFAAARSGQFPVELHPADDPEGVSIGLFTVHEP